MSPRRLAVVDGGWSVGRKSWWKRSWWKRSWWLRRGGGREVGDDVVALRSCAIALARGEAALVVESSKIFVKLAELVKELLMQQTLSFVPRGGATDRSRR